MACSMQLAEVIKTIGHQATIRLVREYGGREYWLPPVYAIHDLHPLVVLIGRDNAMRLAHAFERLRLPFEVNALRQIRNDHIVERYAAGVSISEISRDLQLDRKAIQNILSSLGVRETEGDPKLSQGDRAGSQTKIPGKMSS